MSHDKTNDGDSSAFQKNLLLYLLGATLFVCCSTIIYMVASVYLRDLLRPCSDLDLQLERSGCLRKMELRTSSDIRLPPNIHNLKFSPDGETLAAGVGLSIKLWRVSDGMLLQGEMYSQDYGAVNLAFTPNGERLISGEGSKFISIWRVSDGQLLYKQQGHLTRILSIDLTSDGHLLATASDNDIKLWRVEDTQLHLLNTIVPNPGGYATITFSADDTRLYSSFWNEHILTIRIWQVETGDLLNEYALPGDSGLEAEFLPQKGLMAQGVCLHRPEVECTRSAVQLWRIEDGTLLDSFEVFDGESGQMEFIPDGRILALGDFEGNIFFWRLKDKMLIHKFKGGDRAVTGMTFSPDGKFLATGGRNLLLWQVP